jgi:hypothetical protein
VAPRKALANQGEGRPISRLQHLREPGRRTRRCLGATVGDSPGGPLKRIGKSHLKPAKSQGQTRLAQTRTRGMVHAVVAPAAHQGGPLKYPLEQAPPRSRAQASLEWAPPRSKGVRLPRAGSASLEGAPYAHAHSHTRVREFNALTTAGRRHHAPGTHAPVLLHQLPRREPIPATVGDCATWPVPAP